MMKLKQCEVKDLAEDAAGLGLEQSSLPLLPASGMWAFMHS